VLEICQGVASDQQVLILVNKKDKAGKIFHEVLQAHGIDASYISGDDSKEVINNTIADFNDKKINILIGSSVVGEGIDVRSTDHLLMCQGGKSEVVIVQAVGRVVRLYEDKHAAIVHDFNFVNTKYMQKHYEQRLNIYDRNFEPKFQDA
jgi:superfamily II DNA or RNA helicase